MTEPTREQLERAIDHITAALKGPMPNLTRAVLAADRADMRMQLLDMDAKADGAVVTKTRGTEHAE